MRKDISKQDDFFPVEKIMKSKGNESVKSSVSIDKEDALRVQKRHSKKVERLEAKLKDKAEAETMRLYGVNKSDTDFNFFFKDVLNNLVKSALIEEQSRRRYNNRVDASTEEVNTPGISEATSGDVGIKKNYSFEELEVLVDNVEDLIDRRNQQFKLVEEMLEVEGEEIFNLKFKYARSFKSFYWVSDGRISIGEERPKLEPGQFSLFNKGIMNSKKMATLSFAVARYLGCKQEDLAPVWFEEKPHFYEESTRRLVEINVVDGKAFGYKDGIKKI